jgi:hypothetical protein
MILSVKSVFLLLYRAWLRARMDSYARNLYSIEAQRANDFRAEFLLHQKMARTRCQIRATHDVSNDAGRLTNRLSMKNSGPRGAFRK